MEDYSLEGINHNLNFHSSHHIFFKETKLVTISHFIAYECLYDIYDSL